MPSPSSYSAPSSGPGPLLTLVLMAACAFWMFRSCTSSANSEHLSLEALPGISTTALQGKDVSYRILEPISYYRSENLALFDVEILDSNIAEQHLCFTGDAERFNGFVAELAFLKANASSFRPGAAASGAAEGVTSLFKGLWEIVRHPGDSAQGIAKSAISLKDYFAKAYAGGADPKKDVQDLADAYYMNTVSEIASEASFSYQETVTDEARATARSVANWKLSGRGLSEVGLLLVPFSEIKAAKISKEAAQGISLAAKAGETSEAIKGYEVLLSRGSLFTQSAKILNSLRRMARLETVESAYADKIIRHLCDPIKLATPNARWANPRAQKLLCHLFMLEKKGGDAGKALDLALVPGVKSEFFYSQDLARRQILRNYQTAKEWGIFDDITNIEKMSRGRSPIIMRGSFSGQIMEMDHIIAVKHAPELGNNMANLRPLPREINNKRRALVDQDAIALIKEMSGTGWKPSPELLSKAALN